jgi:hypothetical protein
MVKGERKEKTRILPSSFLSFKFYLELIPGDVFVI